MYALPLLVVAARAYDSCHVTSVICARHHRRHRGRGRHPPLARTSSDTFDSCHVEGIGGMLQKLDAFYCIFERFRQFLAYILHFSTVFMSCLTQLIVLTISSPLTEVKQHRARLLLGWVPIVFFLDFPNSNGFKRSNILFWKVYLVPFQTPRM